MKEEYWVGRDPSCEFVVDEEYSTVSRKHILITVGNGIISIQDNGSSNGTVVFFNQGKEQVGENPIRVDKSTKICLGNEFYADVGALLNSIKSSSSRSAKPVKKKLFSMYVRDAKGQFKRV